MNEKIRAGDYAGANFLLLTEQFSARPAESFNAAGTGTYYTSTELDRMIAALQASRDERVGGILAHGRINGLIQRLMAINTDGGAIHSVAVAPDWAWAIFLESGECFWQSIPSALASSLSSSVDNGHHVKLVAFGPSGCWLLVYGRNGYQTTWGVPKGLSDELGRLNKANLEITSVSMNQSGDWVVTHDRNGYASHGVPKALDTALDQMHSAGSEFRFVSISDSLSWVIGTNTTEWRSQGAAELNKKLHLLSTRKEQIQHVVFAPGDKWLVISLDNVFCDGLTP